MDARMAIKKLNPYLNFDGNGAEAVKLYERVLGAKVETLSRFSDMPSGQATPETKDRVMHALLRLGADGIIMISDTHPGTPFVQGTNCYLTLDFDDVADMEQKFNALAEGGKVEMALNDTFWGARFGMLTDKLGVHWMFNCELKKG
jgi:PhnB protein